MTTRSKLVLASVILILAMCVLVPWLTRALGPVRGYFAVFCIYWICFCLPAGWYFQRGGRLRDRLSLKVGSERWVPWAVAVQVLAVAVSSWLMWPHHVSLIAVAIAVSMALVNGFCEEFFWRGAFLQQGRRDLRFHALGVILFTVWHVPLALAHGITYPGGVLPLIGGALGLGVFWIAVAVRTDRIGWPVVSHILTNCFAFVSLVSLNFL